MAKTKKFAAASAETINALSQLGADAESAEGTTQEATKPVTALPVPKRGLKNVPITAAITLLAAENPKREGSAARTKFALYATGMTCEEFLDAGGTTPDLAYDTAHGFITVEGYTPPKMFSPKPKQEKTPKEPKTPRTKKEAKVKDEPSAEAAALAAATQDEKID